jgi:hypothetical protein
MVSELRRLGLLISIVIITNLRWGNVVAEVVVLSCNLWLSWQMWTAFAVMVATSLRYRP